jgi:DNA-binding IclR family transcriptional regulator
VRDGYGLNEGVIPGFTGIGMVIRNSKGNPEAAVAAVYSEPKLGKQKIGQAVQILREQIQLIEPVDYPGGPAWG